MGAPNRFDRHRPLLSNEAWDRLRTTPVVLAGVGGLGSHVATHLVRLGVREIELWDPGTVDEPDLNRQVLYTEADLRRPKVEVAAARLTGIDSTIVVRAFGRPFEAESFLATGEVSGRRFVLFDCLDSFAARQQLSVAQERTGCPVFHGGVESWYGQVTTLLSDGGGYTRAFGRDYASQAAAAKPIMPHVVAAVASFQVGEFLSWCEAPERTPLSDAILVYDGRRMQARHVRLSRG
jgi:molybdopterin/thiamine biosynthesis adenylyltransferase